MGFAEASKSMNPDVKIIAVDSIGLKFKAEKMRSTYQ